MSRFRLAPVTALVLGGLVVAASIADVPLARLAHQSVIASGGSLPVWVSAGFGAVGFVVDVVHRSLEPAHAFVWVTPTGAE